MKLSRKSEYACLALIDLSEHYDEGLVKIDDISKRKDIPKKYLEQILLILKGAGYLRSHRGAEGGYRLAKKPSEVTLAEIIRLIDGALAPVESVSKYFYEHTPIEKSKKLILLFRDIRDYIANKLEKTTFADILGK
ncbi:MAG: Rrf2 family transcriptional regulator [Nanoarchaeota archaeon]|nr:Rrf2 family transcriptional regulator [Nanoarchaeota archaeon]MBU1704344.1 Rrf2 family transcriptional regulator [Nanoarchaeota archaeon]